MTPEEEWTPPTDDEADAQLEYQIAMDMGVWEDEETANDALYRGRRPLRDYLMHPRDLDRIPPVRWLVEGILPEDGLAVLVAEPGAGKTFVALDWAAHLTSGKEEWEGHALKQGARVLYIYAEGAPGLRKRRDAWQEHHGAEMRDSLSFIIRAADFLATSPHWQVNTDETDFEQLRQIVHDLKPHLLVVDTMSRAIPGADENDTGTMSLLMDKADQLRELGESMTVLFLHHTNKNGGYRGNSVIRGQINTMIEIDLDGVLRVSKQKDDQEPTIGKIELVEVGETGSVVPVYQAVSDEPDTDTHLRATLFALLSAGPQSSEPLRKSLGARKDKVRKLLADLEAEGLVQVTKVGNAHLWGLRATSHGDVVAETA